jgi:hypothetical protein
MEQIKVFYDRTGNTLTVWFGNPLEESYADEIGDDIIVMKSDDGRVLGFEKLNISFARPEDVGIAFQTLADNNFSKTIESRQ